MALFASTEPARFYLNATNGSILSNDLIDTLIFNIFAVNKKIFIKGSIENKGEATIYDPSGRKIRSYSLDPGYLNMLPADDLKDGLYIIFISDGHVNYSEKVILY